MPTIWIVAIALLGIATLVYATGMFIPRDHAVSVRARFARTPSEIWSAITDFDAIPQWWPDVKSVERKPDVDGRPAWIEHMRHGPLPLVVVEWEAPRKMVARVVDEERRMPFGGTWTWHLREIPGGCEVTISENGFVRNMLFRVIAHYVMGHTRTLESYLRALGSRFGESTTPWVV